MVTNVRKNRHGANETVTLTVERLTHGGEGIGSQTSGEHEGRMVFVRDTCPGDRIEARLTTAKKRFARGVLTNLIESGPGRVESPCDHATLCGGCSWQHVSADVQRDALANNLRFMFRFVASDTTEFMPLRFGAPFGYRTRIRLHAKWNERGLRLGFRERRGHGIVSVDHCLVASPKIHRLMGRLNTFLARFQSGPKGEGSVAVMEDGRGALLLSLRGPWKGRVVEAFEELELAGMTLETNGKSSSAGDSFGVWDQGEQLPPLRILNGGFSQANTEVLGLLVEDLRREWNTLSPRRVLELFCGSGTLTIPLFSAQIESWTAIDGSEPAVMALRDTFHGEKRLKCFVGREPELVPAAYFGQPDVVLMDPPREGASDWLERIIDVEPTTILYVSCDPMTQVRDAQVLSEAGYELVRLYGYDMFPNTSHMESLAVLTKDRRK